MALPKFIITMDGYFRLGMVNQHKDLLKPEDQCIGGGYYHFDYTTNRILLDRESYDLSIVDCGLSIPTMIISTTTLTSARN